MSHTTPILPTFSLAKIRDLLSHYYCLEADELTDLGSYIDQNILVTLKDGNRYVLKIHDGAEHAGVIELQIRAIKLLDKQMPLIALPDTIQSVNGKDWEQVENANGQQHYLRLTEFIPGKMLKDLGEFSDELLNNIGSTVAQTDNVLQAFYDPCASRPDIPWDLKNARQVAANTHAIQCPHKRRLVDFFFMKFENEVEDVLFKTRKSIVHGDMHRYSMMVNDTEDCVSGIIDFGDMVYTHTLCNLAVCLSDIMVDQVEPIATAAKVVSAYHAEFPLTEQEVSILHYLVCTRLAIYLTMAANNANQEQVNAHTQLKEEQIYALLQRMLEVNPIKAEDCYREACGFVSLLPALANRGEANLKQRQRMFAGMLYTHYEQPLHLTGGALQYLYDDQGNTYFDCVNNVSQWGHSNPHIVKPAQKQISRLNTNSRYVYDLMTDYAEQLLDKFPDELNVVFFCNSGSEANDLAIRIARTVTQNNDIVVLDTAYHGHTSTCTDISPNRIDRPGKPGLPTHIHKIPAPDIYRGKYTEADNNPEAQYAAEIEPLLASMTEQNTPPAAFIAESLVGTGGQFVLPEGFLAHIYQHVRRAGGLCIADEVQVGFARTGEHMWCFESQNVVPDIVTFGKPIGNGHPLAALVTTREIADKFDNGVTFFNTFSANPVSCAFGKAVLDVLERDELQANTQQQAEYMFSRLNLLKEKHSCIGDVRGAGLYIGVELVTDRLEKTPATVLAKQVVEKMKQRFVLLNTNGYDNNIIKIKPPLIIQDTDVDRLIDNLDAVLDELQIEEVA